MHVEIGYVKDEDGDPVETQGTGKVNVFRLRALKLGDDSKHIAQYRWREEE